MKKNETKSKKSLSLEKFKIAELKNPKLVVGGSIPDDGTAITIKTIVIGGV